MADEPTGALDSVTGDEVLSLLRGLCRPDTSVVLVTHDPLVAALAGRTIMLRDGLIISDTASPSGVTPAAQATPATQATGATAESPA